MALSREISRHPPLLQRKEGLDLSSLQTGVMGGAPCPIELCRALTDELNIKEMAVSHSLYIYLLLNRGYMGFVQLVRRVLQADSTVIP